MSDNGKVIVDDQVAEMPRAAVYACSSVEIARLLLKLPDAKVIISDTLEPYELETKETVTLYKYAFVMGIGLSEDTKTIIVYQPKEE